MASLCVCFPKLFDVTIPVVKDPSTCIYQTENLVRARCALLVEGSLPTLTATLTFHLMFQAPFRHSLSVSGPRVERRVSARFPVASKNLEQNVERLQIRIPRKGFDGTNKDEMIPLLFFVCSSR
jgi:hypothetical protein